MIIKIKPYINLIYKLIRNNTDGGETSPPTPPIFSSALVNKGGVIILNNANKLILRHGRTVKLCRNVRIEISL